MTRTEFIHNAMVASFAAYTPPNEGTLEAVKRMADLLGLKDLPTGDGSYSPTGVKVVLHEDWKSMAEDLAFDLRRHLEGHGGPRHALNVFEQAMARVQRGESQ